MVSINFKIGFITSLTMKERLLHLILNLLLYLSPILNQKVDYLLSRRLMSVCNTEVLLGDF